MRLIRFLFRLLVKMVGAALILLLILAAGLWVRGRFFSSDEIDVAWLHHRANDNALRHTTHLSLGSAAYINDTAAVETQFRRPGRPPKPRHFQGLSPKPLGDPAHTHGGSLTLLELIRSRGRKDLRAGFQGCQRWQP